MIRTISALSCLLLCAAAATASADMVRRAGEWELTINNSVRGPMTQKICLNKDEPAAELKGPPGCSQPNIVTGSSSLTLDVSCTPPMGGKVTVHAVITQAGPDAYRNETHIHMDGGPQGTPPDVTTTADAKWLGPCKPGDQPGD